MATTTFPDRRTRLTEQIDLLAKRTNVRLGAAERDGRDLSEAEQQQHEKEVAEISRLTEQRDKLDADADLMDTLEQMGNSGNGHERSIVRRSGSGQLLSVGQQFIRGRVYEELRKGGTRGRGWSSATSDEVHLYAATIVEDPASGGALVKPTYRPGIVPQPTRPITVVDLFATGTTDSNVVMVMIEKSTTVNAAAAVLEGAAKPESTFIFEQQQEAVRKLATWVPASEEILQDVNGFRSYLDARLTLFIQLEEEDQILNGDGVAPNLLGIMNRSGLAAPVVRTDPQTNADAIGAQIAAIQAATNLPVTGVVMHPTNWSQILLSKTAGGEYIGDGPFREPNAPTIWGVPVAVTSLITAGTALVGAFANGGQIFRRGAIRVDASNSHADYFIKNLVAIRAEERLALAVYRPAGFGKVTMLT